MSNLLFINLKQNMLDIFNSHFHSLKNLKYDVKNEKDSHDEPFHSQILYLLILTY